MAKMKENVLQTKSLARIKNIHKLSRLYNKRLKNNHKKRLLELMREHIEEITKLSNKNNRHYLTETGDLVILCFELLLENNVSINKVLLKCFKRYETKLLKLIKER
jgi:hypothetical protein